MSRLIAAIILFFTFTSPVFAQPKAWGNTCTDKSSGTEIATLQGFDCLLQNVFSIIIPLAGVASFIILIVGGFQFLTSAGDPKQTQKAQSIITGAIIGLIATLGVWFLFKLLNTITGLDLFQFAVPN